MAIWQHDVTGERFDDGLDLKPGDDGFVRDLAIAHYGSNTFSYIGSPDWTPDVDTETTEDTPAS